MISDAMQVQKSEAEQISIPRFIMLALLPGVMVVIFDWLAAPVIAGLGLPSVFTLFLGNAVFIALFELGYLFFQGQKRNGTFSLKGIVLYRESIPWWQYVVLTVVLLIWGFLVGGMLAPLGATMREGSFAWMPSVFTTDPAALDPGLYSRPALLVTVIMGLVFTGVVIPIAEEFYYRGFLLPRLSRFGWVAPVLNVLFWGLNHFFEPWNMILFIVTFLPVVFVVWWKQNVIFWHDGVSLAFIFLVWDSMSVATP